MSGSRSRSGLNLFWKKKRENGINEIEEWLDYRFVCLHLYGASMGKIRIYVIGVLVRTFKPGDLFKQ